MSWFNKLETDESLLTRTFYLVCVLGFLIRLWHLDAPIADRQSWNQVSTATVIRHFVEDGITPFHPQWDVLKGAETGPRIEAEEAPLFHVAAAILVRLFGWPLEPMARLLSVAGSLVGAVFLFRLTRRAAGGAAALFASCFYLLAPFSWYYGRAIMSDAWMLTAIIAAVERFDYWIRDESVGALCASAMFIALAGLLKPFALHVGFTLALWQLYRQGVRSLFDRRLAAVAFLAVLAPLAWVWYAARIGSLGNVTDAGGSVLTAQHIWGPLNLLWSPKFWFKLQARTFDQAATPIVTALAMWAVAAKDTRRQTMLPLFWLAGFLLYVMIVRDGNQMHDYYQLPVIPALAMLGGMGLGHLAQKISPKWVYLILGAFALMCALYVRQAFVLDLSSEVAGKLVRAVSRHDDLIAVLDPGVTRKNQVLYAAHRRGWHLRNLGENTVNQYRHYGARWLVACLEEKQKAEHPEWVKDLEQLPRVSMIQGPYGLRGGQHFIAVYDLKYRD